MIAALTPLLYSLGPAAVLLVMAVIFAETGLLVGFFLPGDSLLFIAGALVASHVVDVPFWVFAAGVLVAAITGDQVGYLIGRRFGPRVFSRDASRLFASSHAEKAQAFFERHGPKAVILARFLPVVRTFVPVVAGIGRMPYRRFVAYNVIGGAVWSVGMAAAGLYFGTIPFVAHHIEIITIGLASLSLIPAAVAVVRHRRQRNGRADGERDADDSLLELSATGAGVTVDPPVEQQPG
ncbi:VTT domain-containing protein [Aeromicrobium sp.]|uniref:VTT domain-containing protein n=1 Tax=Aeromicrobium sp. TaxID=1871063 RepID=UPI0019AADA32|nr:VTT domain-containing protein [Aeromicrobium sp.]MBC7631722.1 VTT domain-containing protein [Aeromicrobium sp.]